jgi:hypothetical protein
MTTLPYYVKDEYGGPYLIEAVTDTRHGRLLWYRTPNGIWHSVWEKNTIRVKP